MNEGFQGKRGKVKRLMEPVTELESLFLTSTLLEELGERMSTGEPSALERMATLLSHGIVWIITIVEPLSQFRI